MTFSHFISTMIFDLYSFDLYLQPSTFTLNQGDGNLQRRQDLGNNGVDDMTQLEDLHEASLLWNLRIRYDAGQIYTFAGSILIAVNPYKMIPDSYGIQMAKKYAGKPLGAMPPHLFAIAAAAHASLPTPQVVVISGESGAGKSGEFFVLVAKLSTEPSIQTYLLSVSQDRISFFPLIFIRGP